MQASNLVGIYWVLAAVPLWITVLALIIFCIGILYLGRRWFEGLAYNVAFSSKYGDLFLIGVPVLVIWILKSGGEVPIFANNIYYQSICFVLSVFLGIAWQFMYTADLKNKKRPPMVMDSYHNLIVAPLLTYLILFITIPVMVVSGGIFRWMAVILLIFIWAMLVFIDFKTDRLDQPMWLYLNKGIKKVIWRLPE